MSDNKKQLMLRWYDEVWTKNNEGAIDEMFHPEAKAHGIGPEPLIGTEAFKVFYREFLKAYSNTKAAVDRTFVDGDYAITMCTVNATHNATGKPVFLSGVSITRIQDNQIIEGWNYFDFLSLNIQNGKIDPAQLA